jgi:class 3 adenylate cyclase
MSPAGVNLDETIQRVAILYADVSGSTRLYEKFGDQVARSDIHACLKILSDVVTRWDGSVLKTIGDEVMCQFANPVKAAMAASEMQQDLVDASAAGKFQTGTLRIKIGWHYGPIAFRHSDLVGEAPVTAQQIIKLAKAGEILTSGQSVNALSPELRASCDLVEHVDSDAGLGRVDVYRMQWEESDDVTTMGTVETQDATIPRNTLVLEHGDKVFRLNDRNPACRIGRGPDNDLSIQGKFTSRNHAEILYRHGNFHYRDLSVNGSVIQFNDGRQARLHRDEELLQGEGTIGLGGTPEEDPEAAVRFHMEHLQ